MMKVNFSDLENYWKSVDLEIQDLNEVVRHLLSKAHSDNDKYGQALQKLSSSIDILNLKLTCIETIHTHAIKDEISNKAISLFGSGYSWLVVNDKGELDVIATSNQDSPLSLKMKPILTIDVWEHAYYLKYQNLRAEYVKNIWNIIDWRKIEENYLCESLY